MDQQNIVDLDKTENLNKFITNIEELRKEKKIYHEEAARRQQKAAWRQHDDAINEPRSIKIGWRPT